MPLEVAHTADVTAPKLAAAHALLFDVFGAEMTEEDWDHALGGIHVLVWEAEELIGHGAVVQRQLIHGERTLRTGYVEGVAVRADRQRRGHGGAIMDVLERIVRGGYDLGALGATDEGAALYTAHGWTPWRGTTWALTPTGRVRTAQDDDGVYVLPTTAPLELGGELTCDWRAGDLW